MPQTTVVLAALCLLGHSSRAALVLSGTSYSENFDSLTSGLPTDWSIYTGADIRSLGTAATFETTKTSWGDTAGAFKNLASADALTSAASVTAQANSTDRALGIRQTGTIGDPGAAFVLTLHDTLGLGNFSISLKAQMLSVQARSTVWTIDYRVGNGSFVSLGTYSDPGAFGSTSLTFNPGTAWDNQPSQIDFRVAALSASSGTGSRDTFAIDDVAMSFSAVPEAADWGIGAAAFLLLLLTLKHRHEISRRYQTWKNRPADR